jgi:hypothetical protein
MKKDLLASDRVATLVPPIRLGNDGEIADTTHTDYQSNHDEIEKDSALDSASSMSLDELLGQKSGLKEMVADGCENICDRLINADIRLLAAITLVTWVLILASESPLQHIELAALLMGMVVVCLAQLRHLGRVESELRAELAAVEETELIDQAMAAINETDRFFDTKIEPFEVR